MSISISAIFILFVSFNTIYALILCRRFLIGHVINFLQAFEENSLFTAYKTVLLESLNKIGAEFQKSPVRFISSAIILSTCQIWRHEVKNWGSIDPLYCRSFRQNMFWEIRSKFAWLTIYFQKKLSFTISCKLLAQFRYIDPFQHER